MFTRRVTRLMPAMLPRRAFASHQYPNHGEDGMVRASFTAAAVFFIAVTGTGLFFMESEAHQITHVTHYEDKK